MQIILGIVLCLSIVSLPYASGACTWVFDQANIVDTYINKEIYEYAISDDFEFTSWKVTQADGGLNFENALTYFDHSEADRTFKVQTTEAFRNLNIDAYTDGASVLTITLVITLTCGGTAVDSTLLISVTNTNQNAPEFSQKSYTYSLPMPIMPKTDFSLYGDEMITATDIDFSTSGITFSVDPDDFAVTSLQTGNKTYRAVFSANKILRFTESQIYTLTAADSDSPPLTTSVTITLNVDPTAGLDSPTFSSAYYSYNYTGGDTLIPISGDIVVKSDKSNEAKYALTGDSSDSFTLEFKNDTKIFLIGLNADTPLPVEGVTQFVLTLSYTTDVNINAVILITIVNDEKEPEFSKNYYTGTYDIKTDKISWSEPVAIKDASKVELSGDKSSLFQVDPTTYEITPIDTIPTTEFDENANLFLTLTASLGSYDVRATVVISLPSPDELRFNSSYYYGEYTIDNEKGVVSLDGDIGFSDLTDFTGITIAVDSSYSANFKIEQDSSVWKVSVVHDLDSTTLNAYSELAVPITATKSGETTTSTAILILTLPDKVEIKFTNPSYTAKYVQGSDSDTVILDKSINIEGADTNKISISPEDYSGNFEIAYDTDSSSYKVNVKSNLDPSTLNSETQLIITITATETDLGATANTVLILTLPEKTSSLNFEKKHYAAEYIVDTSEASVKLDNTIKITSTDSDNIKFTFEGYNDNFNLEYDSESSSYIVNVVVNLDTTILDTNTQLLITITAATADATDITVLVLTLPEKTFTFEDQQYTSEYVIDSESEGSVVLDKNIIFTDNSLDIQFSFTGYEDYFTLELNEANSAYDVIVTKLLDDNILLSNTQLVLSITASASTGGLSASTVLVLRLPSDKSSLPAFENNYYEANYQLSTTSDNDQIETVSDIKIKSADFADGALSIEEYSDNFIGTCDSNTLLCTISVKANLDEVTLSSKSELLLTLSASNKDESRIGKTVLVLKLPSTSSTFTFAKQHYSAIYTIEKTESELATVALNDVILFNGADSSELTVNADEYSEQLSFVFDTTWTVVVKANLDSDTLSKNTELIISLTATKATDDYSKATLVIKLPDKTTMAFLKPQYTGEYIVDGSDTASVKLTSEIETTDTDIQISLDSYFDNFEVQLDSDLKWTINVNTPLGTTVFTENSQLKLLMTITKAGVNYGVAALVIKLPDVSFSQGFYTATYLDDNGASISSDDITVLNVEDADIQVNLTEYNDYIYTDLVDNKWVIKLSQPLPTDVTKEYATLLTTLVAMRKSDNVQLASSTLLITLPEVDSTAVPKFTQLTFYGQYKKSSPTSSVDLTTFIGFTNSDTVTVASVSIDEESSQYSSYFEVNQREDKTYDIEVSSNLPQNVLNTESSIILTLIASTAEGNKGYAALVINLPKNTGVINFENKHYAAQYIVDTSKVSVILENTIKITDAGSDNIVFTFEGYDDNFKLEYDTDSSSYIVNVKENLTSTILDTNTQLLITISANTDDATGTTVLVLNLPEKSFTFEEQQYTSEYVVVSESEGSVMLDKNIIFSDANSLDIQFLFTGFDDYFKLEFNEANSAYDVVVQKPLDDYTLSSNTQLVLSITASASVGSLSASTVLILRLPLDKSSLPAFENNYYEANYQLSTTSENDQIKTVSDIKIKSADFAEGALDIEEYSDNFIGTCDSETLLCTISVKTNLDETTLSTKTEILLTLSASNKDESRIGKTVLVMKLPSTSSTFTFARQHYSATYTIAKTDTELATVALNDVILFSGADSSELTINADEYSDQFSFVYDTIWTIVVKINLDSNILSKNTELIISLTATKSKDDYSKATLVIKLPDKTTMAFLKPQYTGEYIVDGSDTASVKLTSEIETTDTDVQISLDSYFDNFKVKLDSDLKWTIDVNTPLGTTVFTENTQLKLLMTITKAGVNYGEAALVIKLPDVSFSQGFYTATYLDDNGASISSDDITVLNVEDADIQVNLTEYNNYIYTDLVDSKWVIKLSQPLPTDVTQEYATLLTTLVATRKSDNVQLASSTLLITLPEVDSTAVPKFTQLTFYGQYKKSSPTSSVDLTAFIGFTNSDTVTVASVSIDEESSQYSSYFKVNQREDKTYDIEVIIDLPLNVLNTESSIILTLIASTAEGNKGYAALVINLPKNTGVINFENKHYAAQYIVDTSKVSVILENTIKITDAGSDNIVFTFEGYNDNFKLEYDTDSSSYIVNVEANLTSTILDTNTQLLITISANTDDATGTTVLVLNLPEKSFTFEEEQYTSEYVVVSESEGSVMLDKNIIFSDANSLDIQFSFTGYKDYFKLELNEANSAYDVVVKKPLDDNILSSNTQLVLSITASASVGSLSASTVLVLRLPSDKSSLPAFENNYYEANYQLSTTSDKDQIETVSAIKIKSADFAEGALDIEEYSDNFIGTCDSETLLCTISVKANLDGTILSTKTELLLTLSASNKDGSRIGKTVLVLKLPSTSSTFAFVRQHYSATYTIEKTDSELATVALNDNILFNGADSSELTINADEYTDQFSFVFDTILSTWAIIVKTNLTSDILSKNTELIISLTATRAKDDYSKATLVIKLPDKTTMAFLKVQYTGDYIVDGSDASVVLTPEIETTDTNIQITLDSYIDNFEVKLSSESKWTINVKTSLNSNVFTENSQLKLLMTITKAGVKYGEAALLINLPEPSFSEGYYTATYLDDNNGASISSGDITVINVDAADIQVNLSKYNEYIYTDLEDSKWVVKLSQSLPAEITENYQTLLTTLVAMRKTDNVQLASSTLLIKLPEVDSTTVPKFTTFTFYGNYINSSASSSVDLTDFITFANSDTVTVASVSIEEGSSKYSTYFNIIENGDGTYGIGVAIDLTEDVLTTESSIVLTLVASTAEGNKGYAALVINLPKIPRDTSVHFEDERFLYSGTYENGTFVSPKMTIETTDDSLINVVITNELGVDNQHFSYSIKNKVLTVSVDELPANILSQYAVIPLKLAITDTSTTDTVHAVLNVNINYKTDDGGNPVSTGDYSTGMLVAVIILSILLIAVIIAVILLWFFKIRNARYVKMEEEEEIEKSTKPTFTKNLNRQASTSVPSNSSLRRPTGLPIAFIRSESPTEEASSDFVVSPTPPPVIENEKKVVAFNENVQNIDAYNEIDDEEPSNLQNVADRRPTQYVFGNPMAAVFDSPPSERRESSDYIDYDPDIKKSVVFDENVERMHVDADDDNNSGNEEDTESYNINDDDDLKLRFKAELEVKLEEEFPNETFNETL